MKKYSLGALVAAGLLVGGLSAGSASAADLGGNCCADLEERIAELEATTARKGNRKVSLTISGWVAEQVMWWDDGCRAEHLRRWYRHHDQPRTSSSPARPRSRPAGTLATCSTSKLTAATSLLRHQPERRSRSRPLSLAPSTTCRHCSRSGSSRATTSASCRVGLQSQASDNTAILVDGSGSLVPANWVQFDYGGFFFRDNGHWRASLGAHGIIGVHGVCVDCNGMPAERRPLRLAHLRRFLGVGFLG